MTKTAFLTDATICIGCKACEVACKEWNEVPADGMEWSGLSYDNTKSLGASTWRHVMFLEQPVVAGPQLAETETRSAGSFCLTSASTVRTPAALKPVLPAQFAEPKSDRSMCNRTSVMAADTAWLRVPSE